MAEHTNATQVEETISSIITPETESAEEIDIEFAPRGSICGVRNLYQTEPDQDGETSWTTKLPVTLFEPVETDESAQYALILRKTKCYDGRKSLSIYSVLIQSKALKTFLGKVLDGYPGVTTSLERLEFNRPFRPLVHRWEKLVKAREEEELEPAAKAHVDLFYKIFEEELRDTLARKKT